MTPDTSFWHAMSELLTSNAIIIDRPKGSSHPRYPDEIYPLDYGYLENTTASDGSGIDVWLGSLNTTDKILTGILCTFDTLTKYRINDYIGVHPAIISSNLEFDRTCGKRDAEIKLLIGCNEEDLQGIRDFQKAMHTLYIPNSTVKDDLSN